MASETTNGAVRRLQEQHRAQMAAVSAVTMAGQRVAAATERRAAELSRLDDAVAESETEFSVALAVLATLVHDDVMAAAVAGVDESKVRAARRVVAGDVVAARIGELGARRSRRGPRARASVGAAAARGTGADSGGAGVDA